MEINFNSFFRLRVDITKIKEEYHLIMERIDLENEFRSSKSEYFFTKEQLTEFITYITKATNDLI